MIFGELGYLNFADSQVITAPSRPHSRWWPCHIGEIGDVERLPDVLDAHQNWLNPHAFQRGDFWQPRRAPRQSSRHAT